MFLYLPKHVVKLIQFFLSAMFLCCLAVEAAAQEGAATESCFPRISYTIMLADTLGQTKLASGVEIRGNLMEIYVNPKSGTWTLVLILPRGLACEIGNGIEFWIEPHSNGA